MALRAVHQKQMLVATVFVTGMAVFAKLISFVNQPVMAAALAAVVCAIVTAMCNRFWDERSSSSNSKIKQLLEVSNVDHVHASFSCILSVVVNHANFLVHGWYTSTLTTSFVEKHSCVSLSCKTLLFRPTFGRQMIISRSVGLQH